MTIYLCPEMVFRIFDHRRVRQFLTIALLCGTLLCMFPPQQPAFQWWADQAFIIALSFLLFGLFFLIINKPRLMFVCFGCSAAISFYKNEAPQTSSEQSLLIVPVREIGWTAKEWDGSTDLYRLPEVADENDPIS